MKAMKVMKSDNQCTGIILAGGKSSRMGVDKGLLKINNKYMIEYVLDTLSNVAKEIIIVSDNEEYNRFGALCIKDEVKNYGPVAGLYSGLKESKTETNYVVSCDVPLITSKLMKWLYDNKTGKIDAVICTNDEYLMPLIGVYNKKRTLECISTLFKTNKKKMSSLLNIMNIKVTNLDEKEKKQVLNINTMKDYYKLESLLTI